jgi:hypothetical protein
LGGFLPVPRFHQLTDLFCDLVPFCEVALELRLGCPLLPIEAQYLIYCPGILKTLLLQPGFYILSVLTYIIDL